jgi:hypothetical protein
MPQGGNCEWNDPIGGAGKLVPDHRGLGQQSLQRGPVGGGRDERAEALLQLVVEGVSARSARGRRKPDRTVVGAAQDHLCTRRYRIGSRRFQQIGRNECACSRVQRSQSLEGGLVQPPARRQDPRASRRAPQLVFEDRFGRADLGGGCLELTKEREVGERVRSEDGLGVIALHQASQIGEDGRRCTCSLVSRRDDPDVSVVHSPVSIGHVGELVYQPAHGSEPVTELSPRIACQGIDDPG